ncbi:hypothetical protein CGCSCA5_v007951 [Colletotrichum siamense]|nr:hypothetical protein CGCSCA5_v007951 [Colletotrichum siamense]
MEAIGIAASLIGIGQALLTVRNVVEMLQEIPKIGNELASLNNEIESLRAAVEAAKTQRTISREDETEGPDLRIAKAQITDIANKLENVRLKCVQIGHNGKIKPKRARWFWMQKELRQCRDKARDARAALQLALATLNLKSTMYVYVVHEIHEFALRSAKKV